MRPSPQFGLRLASTILDPLTAGLDTALGFLRGKRRIGHLQCCGKKDAILIRGAAGGVVPYWPGAPALAKRLGELNYVPTIINNIDYVRVADEIELAVHERRMADGVTIIGYSFGADSASLLASRLDKLRIDVGAMVLIESTWGIPIPANVDCCINYYKTRLLDFIPSSRGIQVAAVSPRTKLTNINVREHESLQDLAQCNHFTVGNSPRMHDLVIDFLQTRMAPAAILSAAVGRRAA